METKVFQLTEKYKITLCQVTRNHLIQAIAIGKNVDGVEGLKPTEKDRPGMTHQIALQSLKSYADQWAAYEEASNRILVTSGIGAAWRRASIDMEEGEFEAERAGAMVCGKRLGLTIPDEPSDSQFGELAFSVIQLLVGEGESDGLGKWIWKGAGLWTPEAVEAERKSQESDGERPAPGGRKRRNKAKNPS